MTRFQSAHDLAPSEIPRLHQHGDMVEEVRHLLDATGRVPADAGKGDFHPFFADLLADTLGAFLEQLSRVTRWIAGCRALPDDL